MKNSKHHFVKLVFSLLTLGSLTAAYGQITPSQDSYTNSATPTINYGAKTLLDVDAATQVTYIQFNLASIPAGASVSQATLKLYVNAVTTAGSFNVDYVNGTWAENTITFNLAPALGSTIVSGVPVTVAEKNQFILIDVTPALQAWLDGSQANDGIALVADGTFNATFDSKENTTTSHPPELDIVFAGGTLTGVTTASGSGLTGGGTSGTLNLGLLKTCSNGQVLQWNGSAWACATGKGTGTIAGVTAGTDLTGGGTSGNVTLNLDTTRVPLLAASNTFAAGQTINTGGSSPGLSVSSTGGAAGVYSVAAGAGIFGESTTSTVLGGVMGVDGSASGTGTGVYGTSPLGSGVTGKSGGFGVYGQSTSSYGVYGQSSGGGATVAGVYGFNSAGGTGVTGVAPGSAGQGVWGESFGTTTNGAYPDGVHGVAHSVAGSGVAGYNLAVNGTGVWGSDTQGYGFATDSHVQQARGMGGWVKAMAYIEPLGTGIIRCFNSQLTGSAASTAPCGMTFTYNGQGDYTVDFGFEVDDRFPTLTLQNLLPQARGFLCRNSCFHNPGSNQLNVLSADSGNPQTLEDGFVGFLLVVF